VILPSKCEHRGSDARSTLERLAFWQNSVLEYSRAAEMRPMNAAIRAVVRTALAQGWEAYGILSGFSGLLAGC
jgi:hypothetical protein